MRPLQIVFPLWTQDWWDGPLSGFCIYQSKFCFFTHTYGEEYVRAPHDDPDDIEEGIHTYIITDRIYSVYEISIDLLPSIFASHYYFVEHIRNYKKNENWEAMSEFYDTYNSDYFLNLSKEITSVNPIAWFSYSDVDWTNRDASHHSFV